MLTVSRHNTNYNPYYHPVFVSNWPAQIIQHEVDHCDGILI